MRGISVPTQKTAGPQATFYVVGHCMVNTSEKSVFVELLPYENAAAAAKHGDPSYGAFGKSMFTRNAQACGRLRKTHAWRFSEFSPPFDLDGDVHAQVLSKALGDKYWHGACLGNTDPPPPAGNVTTSGNLTA